MAYRRPAIQVIQEFQQAAAALALPTLPACVVGPCFQVKEGVNAGIYDETVLSVSSYAYEGLASGAVVDLTDAPEDEADATMHKAVSVELRDALLVKLPALPLTTLTSGELVSLNYFDDTTGGGAFSGFDPDAAGEPNYYVEILSGANAGRHLVTSKVSDSRLQVAFEWDAPATDIEYRILIARDVESYPDADLADYGITKTSTAVTIDPGLTSTDTVAMTVVEGDVYLGWRALRPDLAGALNVFIDVDSLEAIFGVGAIVPSNIGPYAVSLALQNTTTEVSLTGLGSDYYTNVEQSYQSALEYLETKDVYAITVCSQNTAVHQLLKSHVEGMSASTVGKERIGFVNRKIVELEVLAPSSGIGTVTSAGTGNGTSGTDNKTFRDPTNGSYVTDSVNTGHFLEITSYTAVQGIERSVTPNEADHFDAVGGQIQITNGAFVSGDVGKKILVRGATTAANEVVYNIDTIDAANNVSVTPSPNTSEAMLSTTRTWIASVTLPAGGAVTGDITDNVVAATRVWTFNSTTFDADDVGKLMRVTNTSGGLNDGIYTITAASGSQVTTLETPAGGDETFTGGNVEPDFYSLVRTEPSRDVTSDEVNGTTREWTILNGAFTADDVGRKLDIAGADNAGNNGEHIIEAVLSATKVRTDNTTTPVTETFNGLVTNLTTLDVLAVTPSTTQAAYITDTRHEISSVTSENQLVLVNDPTGGFGGTLEDVVYRITKDLTLAEQADTLAGYSTSLGTRRIVATWPDVLAVSINAVATKVPGYLAGAAYVGMCAGLPSQAGFTNLTLTGFVGRENSDDVFSDTQLDTIAGGGTMILTQPVVDGALSVRHQLTTDVSTIYYQELSVTKNVDLLARFFRNLYAPFLGIYNITDSLLDLLKTRGEGGVEFLKSRRAPRVGAPLRNGQLSRIEESTTQPDSVEIDVTVDIPLPLNNITLTLLV